jgi:hypothetical protein
MPRGGAGRAARRTGRHRPRACPNQRRDRPLPGRVRERHRNILAKIPAGIQAEVKDAYRAIFDTEDLNTPPAPKLIDIIDGRIDPFASRYRGTYPAAVKSCSPTARA